MFLKNFIKYNVFKELKYFLKQNLLLLLLKYFLLNYFLKN